MKISRIAASSICFALIGLVFFVAPNLLKAESELHFRLVDSTLVVVTLNSDRGRTFDFVLDTGADTTVVDPAIAHDLSFVASDQISVASLSGTRTVLRGSIPSLSIGPMSVENIRVLLLDLPELRKLDQRIAGVLGQNFLSHFNYLIDYHKQVVRFELDNEVRDAINGDRVAFESTEDRMIVASAAQSGSSAVLNLVLDSGADSLILLRPAFKKLNPEKKAPALQVVSGDQVEMQTGTLNVLTVGSQKFHQVTVAMLEREPGVTMGDGLLPTTLFRAIYVNNRDRFVVLNPRMRKN